MSEMKPRKKKNGCLIVFFVIVVIIIILLGSAIRKAEKESKINAIKQNQAPVVYEYIEQLKENSEDVMSDIIEKKDDVELITFYYSKFAPQHINKLGLYIYFSEHNGKVSSPITRFQYEGTEWIFFDKIVINSDGEILDTLTIPSKNKTQEVYNGGVYEMYQTSDSLTLFDMIEIAKSKNTTIRFKSNNHYKDYTLTQNDIQGLRNIIDAYQLKSGEYLTDWK